MSIEAVLAAPNGGSACGYQTPRTVGDGRLGRTRKRPGRMFMHCQRSGLTPAHAAMMLILFGFGRV
jgi:hypothetical protein